MKKTYLEPDVEFISLVPKDAITANDDYVDGDMGLDSSWEW